MFGLVVDDKFARAGAKGVGRPLGSGGAFARTFGLVFFDHVEAARSLAVNPGGKFARLPDRQGAAEDRRVGGLALGRGFRGARR